MNGGKQGTRGRATQVRDAVASLDVLAAQLRTRGWTAYLATPPGRLASLVVEAPRTARSAATSSPRQAALLVISGTGSAGARGSRPPTHPPPRRM